jgi:hypothetical protein
MTMSQSDLVFVSSEFDIFAPKPVQHAIQEKNGVFSKSIAPIDQSDLEFLIPADSDMYVDPDIKYIFVANLQRLMELALTQQIKLPLQIISYIRYLVNVPLLSTV